MLSRVADSLYWMGRYAERTATNVQVVSTMLESLLEHSWKTERYKNNCSTMIKISGCINEFESRYTSWALQEVIHYLVFDEDNLNSIVSTIKSTRYNARNTRDLIPDELWEAWNELYLTLKEYSAIQESDIKCTTDFLTKVRKAALIATGVIDSIMVRDERFLFINLGKWIERSEKTALINLELLKSETIFTEGYTVNIALQLTNSFEEFTKRVRVRDYYKALNFLISDGKCSRSVGYCIKRIDQSLLEIEEGKVQPYSREMFNALYKLEETIQIDAKHLSRQQQIEWINDIRKQCTDFGTVFSKTYYLTCPELVS